MTGASKIYTKGGDKGKTSLIGGTRVSKAHLRLEAYGTLDELNSLLGVVVAELHAAPLVGSESLLSQLFTLQNDLFNVGSQLACEDESMRGQLPGVSEEDIKLLEKWMDEFSAELQPLKNFILPGGAKASAQMHIARTVCRRAERLIVSLDETVEHASTPVVDPVVISFVNRLSDYLFVAARFINHLAKIDEPIWGAKKIK